jgi:hypothetical protein
VRTQALSIKDAVVARPRTAGSVLMATTCELENKSAGCVQMRSAEQRVKSAQDTELLASEMDGTQHSHEGAASPKTQFARTQAQGEGATHMHMQVSVRVSGGCEVEGGGGRTRAAVVHEEGTVIVRGVTRNRIVMVSAVEHEAAEARGECVPLLQERCHVEGLQDDGIRRSSTIVGPEAGRMRARSLHSMIDATARRQPQVADTDTDSDMGMHVVSRTTHPRPMTALSLRVGAILPSDSAAAMTPKPACRAPLLRRTLSVQPVSEQAREPAVPASARTRPRPTISDLSRIA